jgi:signal transduction histidine kinase
MITEILETARLRDGYARLNLKEIDLVALVGSIIAGFAGSSPEVDAKDMPVSMPFIVDPELCRTVLKNIITNAVKYSGSDKGPVSVSLLHKPGFVAIEVRDHGVGIPVEDLPHIFEPFYRVEKSRSQTIKGYGLGLNLCKTIVEAHKGRIGIESSPGEGTTVTLSFPEKIEKEN